MKTTLLIEDDVDCAKREKPDLILLDLGSPDLRKKRANPHPHIWA